MTTEGIVWETVGYDARGHETDHRRFIGHSFLTQYYKILFVYENQTYGAGGNQSNVTNTAGVSTPIGSPNGLSVVMGTQAIAGDNTYGIQVGTNATANTGATFSLGTLIANGVAAGQLTYGSMAITSPTGTAPLSYTFTRTFTNASGGDIILAEIGYVNSLRNAAAAQDFFMTIRDVLSPTVTVVNGGFRTFTGTKQYTIA